MTDSIPPTLAQFPLDHLAIAVTDLDQAAKLYTSLGFNVGQDEFLAAQKIKARMATKDNLRIELLEADPKGSGPIGKFIEKRGPGIHHFALRVDDLNATLAKLLTSGIQPLPGYPAKGLHDTSVAFLDIKATGGALIELVAYTT